jgi:hypothetical protein
MENSIKKMCFLIETFPIPREAYKKYLYCSFWPKRGGKSQGWFGGQNRVKSECFFTC